MVSGKARPHATLGTLPVLLAYLAATVPTLFFWEAVLHRLPFALYFPAVAFAAFRSGRGAAIALAMAGVLTVAAPHRFPADLLVPSLVLLVVSATLGLLAARRDRTAAALQSSERQYRLMVENVRDYAMFMTDRDGTVTKWNAGAERVLGWREAEIVGRPASVIFTPEDLARGADAEEMQAARRDGHAADERWHRRKDGSRFFAVGMTMRVDDEAGNHVGFTKVLRDATERVRNDEARRMIEFRWQRLVEQSPVSIQVFAPDGSVRQVNRAWERLWGITLADVPNYNILRDPQLAASGMMPRFERAFAGESVTIDPVPYTLDRGEHAGRLRWVGAHIYPVKNDAGEVEEVVLAHEDVTERREAEEALRTFQFITENANDSLMLADADGRIVYANRFACEHRGYAEGELVGVRVPDLDPNFPIDKYKEIFGRAARERVLPFETAHRRRDGSEFPVEISLTHVELNGKQHVFAAARDITDRKREQSELRAARDVAEENLGRWRAVFGSMADGVVVADAAGNLSEWNAAALAMHGYASIDAVRRHLSDFPAVIELATPDGRVLPLAEWPMSRALRGESFAGAELDVRRLDVGLRRMISYSGSPVLDGDGRVLLAVLTLHDITERKAAEAALRESEARFRLMADAVPQIVWITDAEGRVQFFNQQWSAYTGLAYLPGTAEEVTATVLHPEDRAATALAFANALRTGETYFVEHRIRSAAGEYRWFLVRGEPYRDPETGRIVRWFGASVDIHDRIQAEAALRGSEARLRQMADAMPQMIWVARPDGYHEFYNRRWYEFTGVPDSSTDGEGWAGMFHPADQEGAWAAWRHSLATGEPYEVEYRLRHRSGEYRWTLGRALPVRDEGGEIQRWIGTCTDIDALKRLQQEREHLLDSERGARAEAERASRMKDEFLATLSHELRTPLSAILGWSQILRRPSAKPDTIAEGLNTIERNARVQTQIIEDLLDMSRIISGKIVLATEQTNLAAVVGAAIQTVSAAATAKAIEVVFDVSRSARHPVLADPNRLQQVFWNLLSNAIKFTPRGGVVHVGIEQRQSQWQVDVTDTGEGISPEFLPHVFERFRQQDGSTTRRHGGLGLGLSIVKQLVELHGGTVRVASAGAGQGAMFTVSLPVSVLHADSRAAGEIDRGDSSPIDSPSPSVRDGVAWDASTGENLAGIKVLVVDDEADARALLLQLLSDCKADVTVAATADEAIESIERERPDVLVSDIGMPGEDGYALLRRVRALGAERGGSLPAIALTAYARAEDRVKAVRAGFEMHVPKPVEPAELIAMVANLVRRDRR